MEKNFKDFVDAFNALFGEKDDACLIAKTRAAIDSIGEYQGPLKDKENMSNDMLNIYSDMNIAIKEGYGKTATKQ